MNNIPIPNDIPLPLPATEPVLVVVLILFFLMHIVFVSFMVGGSLLALYYELRGLKDTRYDLLAHAIASTVTANKSIAVVLGIGPLLAINTLYTVYFYTANALTGTLWISIVPLVVAAFLLTYAHKYLWYQMAGIKWLHIGLSIVACLLFLFIPLIFLTNINLMLFPDKWLAVHGFFSALTLPNVFPRYVHFLLTCPALTGLFLVWFFRRRSDVFIAESGFPRSELIRKGYQWALWPTLAQFLIGPIVLITLPKTPDSIWAVEGSIVIGSIIAAYMMVLMFLELRHSPENIGDDFGVICILMVMVIGLMGIGRHYYREAAISSHRELVRTKTLDYMRQVGEANRQSRTTGQTQ